MNGELDLELYTISILKLNNVFEKLQTDGPSEEVKKSFKEVSDDFQNLYEDIINDLNLDELQLNEYYLFFENGKQIFPHYIEMLENVRYAEIEDSLKSLINVFNNFNKISMGFPKQESMIQ